ncbi:MAG: hypothetical protein F6K42_30910 [Leptolyngbya sp. SIO1D8]|nr:hypothetical protein [Leptolyngbya sp. SIO1D8]
MVRAFRPVIRLEKEVNAWTDTNLELIRLLTAHTQETERLAQNFVQLSSTYAHLNSQLAALQQRIPPSSTPWTASQTPPLGLSERQVQSLFSHLKQLTVQVQAVSARSRVETWIWNHKSWFIGIAIAGVVGLGLYAIGLQRQVQHLERLQNSTLIRLERIERAIGTAPE